MSRLTLLLAVFVLTALLGGRFGTTTAAVNTRTLITLAFAGWACALATTPSLAATEPAGYDLVVYGGTPAGITAAIAAAR